MGNLFLSSLALVISCASLVLVLFARALEMEDRKFMAKLRTSSEGETE